MAVERWYPSKVDWWVGLLLVIGPLAALAGLVVTLRSGQGASVAVALAGPVLFAAIYVGLVFPMRYGIDSDALVVRFGLVRLRIPLADIVEVRPTRNPLSSPALSLDRLAVSTGDGSSLRIRALISPAARSDFLAELAARARLRRDGDRLVR
jgi:hypothetical protein